MIYTLTFNPAIDYAMYVDTFKEGVTNRSSKEVLYFGGKGINVSIMLSHLGKKNTALGFIAGFTGDALEDAVKKSGVKSDFIKLKNGVTRINFKLKGETETEINAAGPDITEDAISKLFRKLDKLKSGDTLILSGSVPPSMPKDIYATICERMSGKGIRLAADATRDLLLQMLKYRPFVIKPNLQELEETLGRRLETDEDIVSGAKELKEMGAENVLVSLGKRGAVLIDSNGGVHRADAVGGKAVNTVGAGDSMLAGFLAGADTDFDYALRLALAAGGATACSDWLAEYDDVMNLM